MAHATVTLSFTWEAGLSAPWEGLRTQWGRGQSLWGSPWWSGRQLWLLDPVCVLVYYDRSADTNAGTYTSRKDTLCIVLKVEYPHKAATFG